MDITKFGMVLKAIRQEKQISQTELAKLADLDRSYISMLERGQRKPSLETTLIISEALEVLPAYFINELVKLSAKEMMASLH